MRTVPVVDPLTIEAICNVTTAEREARNVERDINDCDSFWFVLAPGEDEGASSLINKDGIWFYLMEDEDETVHVWQFVQDQQEQQGQDTP